MDAILVLTISSIALMIATNLFLKYRLITLLKVAGYVCGVVCFATLLSVGADNMVLLVIEGLAVFAAAEVLYFSNILKYTNNYYHEISKKFIFYNVSFYILSFIVILVHVGVYDYIATNYFPLPLSVIFLSIFLKMTMASTFIWNRGNIFFAKNLPNNDKIIALKYIDFLSLVAYTFAFILADFHDRVVLIVLAGALLASKTLLMIIFLWVFRDREIKTRLSLTSVVSVSTFFFLTMLGIFMCL